MGALPGKYILWRRTKLGLTMEAPSDRGGACGVHGSGIGGAIMLPRDKSAIVLAVMGFLSSAASRYFFDLPSKPRCRTIPLFSPHRPSLDGYHASSGWEAHSYFNVARSAWVSHMAAACGTRVRSATWHCHRGDHPEFAGGFNQHWPEGQW